VSIWRIVVRLLVLKFVVVIAVRAFASVFCVRESKRRELARSR
jgi:hypothetical protein